MAVAFPGGGPTVPGPALLTPAPVSTPDASTLLKALRRRWLLALTLGLLCAGGAGVTAWFFLPAKSTVFSLVLISSHPSYIMPRERHIGQAEAGTYMKTTYSRIKARSVLNAALTKNPAVKPLKLVREQSEPIQWLEDELKVESQEGSEIVKISMAGFDPAEMLILVDAVTTAYLDEMGHAERQQRTERLHQLEHLHNEARDLLQTLQEKMIKQAKDSGTHESQIAMMKQQSLLGNWSDKQKELNQVKAALGRAQRDLDTYKKQAEALEKLTLPEDLLNKALEGDPTTRRYTDQKIKIEEILQEYQEKVLPTHSTVVRLRGQLDTAQKQLDKRRAEVRAEMTDRYRKDARRELEMKIPDLQKLMLELDEEQRALTTEVARLKTEVDKLGNDSAEMVVLKTEIAQQQHLVTKLADEHKALEAELNVPPRVSLYQSAAVQRKDIKRQLLATILAPVSAFVCVCLLIGWWEHRGRRVHSADEVVTGLGLRLVGAVPPLSHETRGRLVGAAERLDPHEHNLLESIDGIRTVLLRDASVSAMRVVMVTSATSGEGKTTLAGHLAISLARAGRRTLLLDSDLRRPAAHQLFEQALQPGLSEVLLKEIDLTEALRPTTALEGLWLLPAGQWDREVLQALAQEETMRRIFERLRAQFDIIVVDSSPVLAATDSLLVGQHVDGVILSLLRDLSQVPLVHGAVQRLTSLGIRVLGAVVNGLKPDGMYSNAYQYLHQSSRRSVTAEQV
jgi:capsular exopolysaccharide synthesis family protein